MAECVDEVGLSCFLTKLNLLQHPALLKWLAEHDMLSEANAPLQLRRSIVYHTCLDDTYMDLKHVTAQDNDNKKPKNPNEARDQTKHCSA